MIDRHLRPVKGRALEPIIRRLGGVSPTTLSLAGLAVGLGAAGAAAAGAFGLALGLWLANRLLDGLDGEVARMFGRTSDVGGYIDLVTDFVVYAAVPLGIAMHGGAFAHVAILMAAYYVNAASWMLLSQLAERRGSARSGDERTTVAIPGGLIEGTETAVAYTLLLVVPGAFRVLVPILAGAVLVTAVQRMMWANRTLTQADGAIAGAAPSPGRQRASGHGLREAA